MIVFGRSYTPLLYSYYVTITAVSPILRLCMQPMEFQILVLSGLGFEGAGFSNQVEGLRGKDLGVWGFRVQGLGLKGFRV